MPVHLHTLRAACAGALGLILAAGLLQWAYTPPPAEFEIVPVSGRVTCGGQPLGGMWIVFEEASPRGLTAFADIQADGSFRMHPWGDMDHYGIGSGTYRVYVVGHSSAGLESSVDPRYQNPGTTDLLVQIGPGWDDLRFDLPVAGHGPMLAQHR